MGIGSSNQNYAKKRKAISLISLNYSGILLSPFEFFSKQDAKMSAIQTNLSNIYKSLLKKTHPQFSQNKKDNKFKWNLGKIDQKMQQERYSPLYNRTAGISGNKFETEEEFRKKWLTVFDQNVEKIKQRDPTFKYSEQQKKQTLEFDLLCYKCILTHVYGKDFSANLNETKNLNIQQYKQFMHLMFDKTFLNEQKKIQKTISAMVKQRIDIVFAQEANESLIKRLESFKDYTVYKREGCDSIIVVKREKFHNFYNCKGQYPLSHLPELEKELMWNNDTMIVFVDNLILISGHLSSKKQKNPQQVFEMMQSLKKLHAIYPMCHIIVGCDANSFVPGTYKDYLKQKGQQIKEQNNFKMQIFPGDSASFTTSKQRTYLQPQINKAEQVARVCRDHLIVLKAQDIQIEETKVCTIGNRSPSDVENLPCEEHPYDHYVVKAIITVNVMTHFGKNYDDGK